MVIKRQLFVWGSVVALLIGAAACEPTQPEDSAGAEGEAAELDDDKVVQYYEGLSDEAKSTLMGRMHGKSGSGSSAHHKMGGDEATDDEATDDEATGDEATGDEVTGDEATSDTDAPSTAAGSNADELQERTGVTARGPKELTLLGPDLEVGDTIPSFQLKTTEMEPFTEMDLQGKWALISVVPSLDTPVCETQTTTLGARREEMPENSVFVTISRDLPFAQRRFNQTHPMDTILVSDFADASFGKKFGVLVKETGLLARSLWLVNPDGEIVYRQIVGDQGNEPDYDAMMNALATNTAN